MAEDSIPDLSRPQMFLFGCVLKSDKKEHKVEVDDDDADHQLSLKAVCLGADAEDKFHTVEIEGVTYDGKMTKIPLAVLKPSILPSLSLGGFEITPPVSFRLQSGAGPVYISGQHFVSTKESDDEEEEEEEENNTSPVKRPSNMPLKKLQQKKLKIDSDEDDDEEDEDDSEDDDDDDDDDEEDEKAVVKSLVKPSKQAPEKKKSAEKQNGSPGKKDTKAGKPQSQVPVKEKEKSGAGPSGKSPNKLSVSEVKNRLATAVKEGKPLPKTEQKFENYTKSAFKISDKQVIKDLWNFVQTLKK